MNNDWQRLSTPLSKDTHKHSPEFEAFSLPSIEKKKIQKYPFQFFYPVATCTYKFIYIYIFLPANLFHQCPPNKPF